ncbi:MAG TPA: DNA polymerase/3'-5' exonuclease PolX [Candidatus Krumholzibacteria bacterium]|nr:DNA polymerase/3'-5' exonuclease PolX [Candidatus Krumholzibacteria bacterium]
MASARKTPPPRAISKADVARALDEVAAMLEITGSNPFRIRAFFNAARAVEDLSGDLNQMVASGELLEVRGIGKSIFADVKSMLETGTFDEYEKLRAQVPAGVLEMMRISGMGPKKVKAVYDKLKVTSIDELEKAGRNGWLAELPGFGEKTQTNILAAIARHRKYAQRFLFSTAWDEASRILEVVRGVKGVKQSFIGGSLRRCKETIGDVDILATAADADPVMNAFVGMSGVATIIGHGPTKSSVILESGIHVDLRVVKDDEFPAAAHYFTGSKEHNTEVRARAKKQGFKLNEYGLFKESDGKPVKLVDEAALFKKLGMDFIPPELRENTGEIEAAEKHELPVLIEVADIRGTFHCHTTYSDGHGTLDEMARAAKALGLEYLGIADHSKTAVYANGLSVEDVKKQRAEIEALNKKLAPFVVFAGIESDILQNGDLDYDDQVLESFDYVVASVHGQFTGTEAQMTERIVRAVSNPYTTMLGHPTGRVLLSRDGYPLNLEKVFEACVEHNTWMEINAHPYRLDLDWRHVKRAKEMGVRFVINPDAHSTKEIAYYKYGVNVARKGWLVKDDVANTRTLAAIQKLLNKKSR